MRVTWEDFGTGDGVLNELSVLNVSAKKLTVDRNEYSEADRFSCVIDYNSFPFDPRCVRAMGVTICMEDMGGLIDKDGNRIVIEPKEGQNIIFIGFADEASTKFNDDTREVSFEGRDYTALFIDVKRINTDPIPLSKPIDSIIQELINEQKATVEIAVDNRTGGALPTLAKLAPDFNEATAVKNQKRGETYWDIITDILGRVGLVGFIEVDKFVITKPQNIYEKKNFKQFIYGGNIKSFELKRKLGRSKDFNVLVKSFNLLEKRVEEAKIPKDAKDAKFIKVFGNKEISVPQLDKKGKKVEPAKIGDYFTFPVKDITSKEQLIKIGESIFEEMARQQIDGELTTYEMLIPEEGLGRESTPIKFSELKNGTAIKIYLTQSEVETLNEITALGTNAPKSDKQAFLIRRGYPPELANAFADSLSRINTALYVNAVKFEIDNESGFSMTLNFVNFIDIDSALLGGK